MTISSPPEPRAQYYGEYKIVITGRLNNGNTADSYVWLTIANVPPSCTKVETPIASGVCDSKTIKALTQEIKISYQLG